MDNLQSIKNRLIERIRFHQPQTQEISEFRIESVMTVTMLSWLKAQQSYPQFYFNFRDSRCQLAALGKVRSFSAPNQAQDFVRRLSLPLLGGLKFYDEGEFFLPRLLLRRHATHLTVSLFIDNRKPLRQECDAALSCLETFANTTALCSVHRAIRLYGQKATQTEWCQWVEQALAAIRRGELRKSVLANETCFQTESALNAKDFLAESERRNLGCYHFLWAQDAEHAFVGSPPERLYRREGTQLQTEALAGTALMTEDAQFNRQQAQWLLQDQKNIYENQLVADDIRHKLQPYVRQLTVSELGLKQLRQVQHLRRHIFAELHCGYGDETCLQAMHPTAAVAGLPQRAALDFLRRTECFNREWYAGTLGIMETAQAEFCVAIRSAFVEGDKIRVFAGAGIVEGSVPLLEWQEIERKALGLVSLLQE
ncbi:isochorismate synthase [Necropsobacter massiliensis]|uniref:isochorismate synthase n=1 Tax=Necropsobacter massiliensis TaxID=1400001 RepID=UPI000595CABB|nr:isochorismate synthase [Necropsobacter massiliensis]